MQRKTVWITIGIAGAALLVVGILVAPMFLPEATMRVNEAAPDGDTATLKRGTFNSDPEHTVTGTVQIIEVAGVHYLRFENYNQTPGPDVFVYLTESETPNTKQEVEGGLRVLIDGGADGGESTKVGTFNQRLPDGFDPSRYHGVAIWCDQFNTPFGHATLTAA